MILTPNHWNENSTFKIYFFYNAFDFKPTALWYPKRELATSACHNLPRSVITRMSPNTITSTRWPTSLETRANREHKGATMTSSAAAPTSQLTEGKPPPNALNPNFIDRLDQDIVKYYNEHIATRAVTHAISIEELRANKQKYASAWCRDSAGEPFVNVIQITADDGHVFTTRCYHPDETASPFGKGPENSLSSVFGPLMKA